MNPYNRYASQSVMTMTHGEMLIKLFDGAIRNMNQAKDAIGQKDYTRCNELLQKTQRIITYLNSTLDRKYEMSEDLSALYFFFNRRILQANAQKSVEIIDEVNGMVTELRDTFATADRLARQSAANTATASVGWAANG